MAGFEPTTSRLPNRALYQAELHPVPAECTAAYAHEHDDEAPRAVDALDALEADVGRRRRARRRGRSAGPRGRTARAARRARARSRRPARRATTQTWRSGTSVIARRPWPGPPSNAIVPVSAHADGARRDAPRRGRRARRRPRPSSTTTLDAGRPERRVEVGRRRRPAAAPCQRERLVDAVDARRRAEHARAGLAHLLDEARDAPPTPRERRRARSVGALRAARRRRRARAGSARAPPHAPRSRASHHSRNVCSATPGSVRERPQPASGPGSQRRRSSRTTGRCSARAVRCARS